MNIRELKNRDNRLAQIIFAAFEEQIDLDGFDAEVTDLGEYFRVTDGTPYCDMKLRVEISDDEEFALVDIFDTTAQECKVLVAFTDGKWEERTVFY